MPNQTPLESKNIFSRAAGYLSFLRSCIRSGEDLDEKEHAAVDRIIAELTEVADGDPSPQHNDHIVWAYTTMPDGRVQLLVGLTEIGLGYVRAKPGWTLQCQPPGGMKFADVESVHVFSAPNKKAILRIFEQAGMRIERRT